MHLAKIEEKTRCYSGDYKTFSALPEEGDAVKLAEALIMRAECNKRIEQLKQRIIRSTTVQEGDTPPEDPRELLEEFERTVNDLMGWIRRINRTNSLTEFQPGESLADALAKRDVLLLRRKAYSKIIQSAYITQNRYSRSEVKYKAALDVQELQKLVDSLSKATRELDSRIQELNWKINLMD